METTNAPRRAWEDTWKWIQNSRVALIILAVVGGVLSAVIAPTAQDILSRALYGGLGAIATVCLILLIGYFVHLQIAPYSQRNAAYLRIAQLEEEKKTWELLDGIKIHLGMLMLDGTVALTEFKACKNINKPRDEWPIADFDKWTVDVLQAFKEHKIVDEIFMWVYAIDTDPPSATLDDYIGACIKGIDHLKTIIEKI